MAGDVYLIKGSTLLDLINRALDGDANAARHLFLQAIHIPEEKVRRLSAIVAARKEDLSRSCGGHHELADAIWLLARLKEASDG